MRRFVWQKEFGQTLLLSGGEIEFAAQRHPGAVPLHQVESHVAQDYEIVGSLNSRPTSACSAR